MNIRTSNGYFRTLARFTVVIYTLSIFLPFAKPVSAQAPTGQSPLGGAHKSRLTIPVNKLSTLVIEKGDKEVNKRLLVSDYLSSTKAIVNGNGIIENYPSYYPYGLPKSDLDSNLTDKYYTQQKKVTADSSIYNYNARYYNPTTSLFIQPDSVKGPTRYTYVSNNPVMAADPTGHDLCQQDPSMKYFWRAIGQCGGDEKGEKFMGEEGLNSVGTLMAATEAASGIGGIATWIGDKINGTSAGSDTIDSAYKSLSGGAAAAILAVGIASPDPEDLVRNLPRAVSTKKVGGFLGFGGRSVTVVRDSVGSFIVDPTQDMGLKRFIADVRNYVRENRTDNTISRLDLVNSFIAKTMRYDKTLQGQVYAARRGNPLLGDFYNAGYAVCKEFAALTHIGLEAVGYDSRYVTGRGSKIGHAWVEVLDNASQTPHVVDSTWNARKPRWSMYDEYGSVGASGGASNFLGRIEYDKLLPSGSR